MNVKEGVLKLIRIFERKSVIDSVASLFKTGEPHKESLEDFEKYYREDPVAKAAVDFLAEMICGVGYYTTCEDEKAKQIVDDFAEKVGLDQILMAAVRSMLIYGDAYIEKVFSGKKIKKITDLVVVPSKTIKVLRDEHGRITGYQQKVMGHGPVDFTPEEIVHLSYCKLPGEAYGISLLKPVAKMLETKKNSIEAMGKILGRYAAPKIIWITKSEADAKALKKLLDSLQPDEDLILSGEIQFTPLTLDPRARFSFFYEYLDRQIFEGLKAPLLSWLRNATEASAKVMLEAIDRHVAGVQRYIKRKVEREIFKPLIEAEGLTEVPRLNWGMPKTKLDELSLEDIATLVRFYVISPDQAQVWLQKLGFPIQEEGGGEGGT